MEIAFVRGQQSATDPGDPAMRDNLYEPRRDGQVHGNQDFYYRRSSLWLEAQKRPLTAIALIAAGAAVATMVLRAPKAQRTDRTKILERT